MRSRLLLSLLLGLLASCGDEPDESDEPDDTDPVAVTGMNPDDFFEGSLSEAITEVDCTLANGVETTCYRIVAAGEPTNHELTDVCPRTITDPAAGLWIVDGMGVEVDGPFIAGLAETYDDPNWQMYDPSTGDVYVTDTPEDCLSAGGMPLDPGYANYCVECTLEDIGGANPIEYLIPIQPIFADEPTELDQLAPGVSLNGVQFEFPADIANIEAGYQIAPIDFCGGHVNFNIGYHYHEVRGCIEGVPQGDEHASLIGYAKDGFGIHEMMNEDGQEPADLDACRGHSDDPRGYHYHASGPGENAIIGCLSGVPVEEVRGGPPGGGPPP